VNAAIVVPLDGTRFAEAAIPDALQLARRLDLSLGLVTVWQPLLPLFDPSSALEVWERDAYEARRRYVTDLAGRLEEVSGKPVSVECLLGRPAEVLTSLTERDGLQLVVMATHGRGPVLRASLGSVADQVVRNGKAPVLLIRPEEEAPEVELAPSPPYRRILVPLDGSDLAETALQRSLLFKEGEPVELTLLRVVAFPQPLADGVGSLAPVLDAEILGAERDAARAYLDRVAARLRPWGCRISTRVLEDASSSAGIIDYALSNRMHLIAMATHGRGGASRLLLGSVADKVIRNSVVPVLLFHPERAPNPWHDLERLAGQIAGMP
jgi:nucleotide-binding universal stress UspA family protein